jgi:uncharacterized protein YgiM (DUF1202 family)
MNHTKKAFFAVTFVLVFFVFPLPSSTLNAQSVPCQITSFTTSPSTIPTASSKLSWTSQGCTQLSMYNWRFFNTPMPATGSAESGFYTGPVNFNLQASGNGSDSKQVQVTDSNVVSPTICRIILSAHPDASVSAGQSRQLSWDSTCGWAYLSGGTFNNYPMTNFGRVETGPINQSTTFSVIGLLNPVGGGGSSVGSQSVTVTVPGTPTPSPSIVDIMIVPNSIQAGGSASLFWSATNASNCSGDWVGPINSSGYQIVSPSSTTNYKVTCIGNGGAQISKTVGVTVTNSSSGSYVPVPNPIFPSTQPTPTAPTQTANQTQIQAIQAQITALQAQLAIMTGSSTGGSGTGGSTGVSVGGLSQNGVIWNPYSECTSSTPSFIICKPVATRPTTGGSSGSGGGFGGGTIPTTPPPPQGPTTQPPAQSPTNLQVGDTVETTDFLNVRSSPGTASTRLSTERPGTRGTIIGGPSLVAGYPWWQVTFTTGVTGWVTEDYLVEVGTSPLPPSTSGFSIYLTGPNPLNVTIGTTYVEYGAIAVDSVDGVLSSSISTSGVVNVNVAGLYQIVYTATNSSGVTATAIRSVNVNTTPQPPAQSPTNLQVGDTVETTDFLNVRSSPGTASTRLSTERPGTRGTIIGGPSLVAGYPWWQVTFTTGVTGWVTEDYLVEVGTSPTLLPPPPSTPTPTTAGTCVVNSFVANPASTPSNQVVSLSWSTLNCDFVILSAYDAENIVRIFIDKTLPRGDRFEGAQANSHSVADIPTATKSMILTAWKVLPVPTQLGILGPIVPVPTPVMISSKVVTITVTGSSASILSADKTSTLTGGVVRLAWTAPSNAPLCTLTPNANDSSWTGSKSASGYQYVYPTKTTTYGITCSGFLVTKVDSITITIGAPVTDIKANGSDGPVTLSSGQNLDLSWTNNGNLVGNPQCTLASQGTSPPFSSGVISNSSTNLFTPSHPYYPKANTTYTISCSVNSTTSQDSVAVNLQ